MIGIVETIALLLAGWLDRRNQQIISYLKEENRFLRAQLGSKRLRFTNRDRARIAERGRLLGRRLLRELGTLVQPDTILRWHRELIAKKYSAAPASGRPIARRDVRALTIRMARENPGWGYTRIRGSLLELGVRIGRSTIRRILLEAGIDPAPKRSTTWNTFIKAHASAIAALDFFTVEVMTFRGLVRYNVLFVLDITTRCVEITGIVREPSARWVEQQARRLINPSSGFLRNMKYLIHDRALVFGHNFRQILCDGGVTCLRIPPMSPNLNAYAERWVRSIRAEILNRVIILGEAHLRHVLSEYVAHYHAERPHQGIGNRIPMRPAANDDLPDGPILRSERLGGLLSYYHRRAG